MASQSKWSPKEHEVGLAHFVAPQYRARFRTMLADGYLPDQIDHFGSRLDARFAFGLPHHAHKRQSAQDLLSIFKAKGAPSGCYLFPGVELDWATGRYEQPGGGKIIALAEALEIVVDDALDCGIFVSCIPGRLALYRDHEWVKDRFILVHP